MIQYLLLYPRFIKKKIDGESLVENSVFPVARPRVLSPTVVIFFPPFDQKSFPNQGIDCSRWNGIHPPTGFHYESGGQAECQIAAAILFVPEMLTNCQCAPSTAFKASKSLHATPLLLLPSRAFTDSPGSFTWNLSPSLDR